MENMSKRNQHKLTSNQAKTSAVKNSNAYNKCAFDLCNGGKHLPRCRNSIGISYIEELYREFM